MSRSRRLLVAWAIPFAIPWLASAQTTEETPQAAFAEDVHAAAGLTCSACHKGQTTPAAIPRTAIAPLCASCHSDGAYMRQFDPGVRVDQYAQYRTSVHGQRMDAGEQRVATCSDCHRAHGIRRTADARSSVAPLNVANTCGRCHGDAALMAAFNLEPTPVAEWSASVHAAALLQRGDSSAPTCSTCHGSHGAVPPGVASVANVCAQCHVREAELFKASPKQAIFEAMGQAECLACHSNHRIEQPTDGLIGLNEGSTCGVCHDETMNGAATIASFRQNLDRLATLIDGADQTLRRAERAGVLVDDGRVALREAHEHQIHARVMIHRFADAPFAEVAAQGIAASGRAQEGGDRGLQELQYRRRGLAVALFFLVGFLLTLWVRIRTLPPEAE
jgi:hypothetical protein